MGLEPKFKALNLKDGKIRFYNPEGLEHYLREMPEEIYVVISKKKITRSQQQNRYYWGVVIKHISNKTGYEPSEVHSWLSENILVEIVPDKCKRVIINKKEVLDIPSTTSLTTREFEEYLSKTREWASRVLSEYIPLPDEVNT
jgi:hypothetical protein